MKPDALIERMMPGARVIACVPLTGGVSAYVHAVTYLLPDGARERVVVRRHRSVAGKPERGSRAAREFQLLTLLHARGVAVPRPRLFEPPDTLVQDLIEGDTLLPADAAESMARTLAAIHATDTADLPAMPICDDPLPELGAWLPGHPILDQVAASTTGFAGPSQLLHGDFWPGNLLWHDGGLAAVLDWEDAALGDPLSDVACARVELACTAGAAVAARFTDVYFEVAGAHAARLPIWDLYVATAALRYMDQWGLEPDLLAARRATTASWQAQALRALGGP